MFQKNSEKITIHIRITHIKIYFPHLLFSPFLLDQNPGPKNGNKRDDTVIKEMTVKTTAILVELKT